MKNGVFINMKKSSALVTVAMLSALLSKENKDYLDIITPFILKLLPKEQGTKVDRIKTLEDLNGQYGFEDMPSHVLTLILNRLATNKRGVLYKKNGEHYVRKVFDSTRFDDNSLRMKELIESVLQKLIKYFNANTQFNRITSDEAQTRLITFLNYYGFSVIKDVTELKCITTNTDQNNYLVARFILEEYRNDTIIFHNLLEIIKGFLVYKSIYFFSTEQKKSIKSKLKETVVYFDTRLLIYALGYNRKEDNLATKELIRLIYENGGEVKTFTHNKDEVAGILTKYAKDKDSRNSLSLDNLNANGYDETDVIRLRDSLVINLEKNNIEVVDILEYGTVESHDVKDKGFLDLQELKDKLDQNLRNIGKNPKDISIENDIESISAISRLRGKACPYSIENCKAIFVTTNIVILRTLYELYSERFYKGEICFAITDVDLTSMLWLKSFDKQTNLPCLKLLENAYAACCPSPEVMASFIDKVIQLEMEGRITNEEALLMRTQHSVKEDIVRLSENNPDKISDDLVLEVKKRIIDELNKKNQSKIDELNSENKKYRDKKLQAYNEAENMARTGSISLEKYLKLIFKLLFLGLGVMAIILTIYSYIIDSKKLTLIGATIVLSNAIGLIDTFVDKFGFVSKCITKIKHKKFDKLYGEKIKELEKYYPE